MMSSLSMMKKDNNDNPLNNQRSVSNNLVVIIAGPTGVGKSDIAARLCSKNKGIIVSADSVQAYRGPQIGANKPTPQELQETPHLLIDVANSKDPYNAADWVRDATSCIEFLTGKSSKEDTKSSLLASDVIKAKTLKGYDPSGGALPVVVGGTMMYLQWLVYGRPDAARPTKDAVEKSKILIDKFQKNGEGEGWNEAVAHVSSLDSNNSTIFKDRIDKFEENDWYRLRRTMEIAYTALENSDITIDSLFSGEREKSLESLGYDVRCFFLCPSDRMKHTSIIDKRCEEMILRGLLQETSNLEITDELPDMATKAIGYRQVLEYLNRENFQLNDEDAFEQFLNDFTTATRRYAKKQMAWFRKDKKFLFVPVSLDEEKMDRIDTVSQNIQEVCELSRPEYEKLFLEEEDVNGNVPTSYQMRISNEKQGKTMKFYQFQRYKLERGSEAFKSSLAIADECAEKIKQKSLVAKEERKRQRLQ